MKINKVVFFIIILIVGFFSGCTNNPEKNTIVKVDEAKNLIEQYYNSMEKSDIATMESLFYRKINLDKSMYNFDYIDKIEIKSIEKLDSNNESSKVYIDYVSEEYNVSLENILLYNVSFEIHVKEGYDNELVREGIQKFSIIKSDNNYLIGELFR